MYVRSKDKIAQLYLNNMKKKLELTRILRDNSSSLVRLPAPNLWILRHGQCVSGRRWHDAEGRAVPMRECGTSFVLSADGKRGDTALQANILLVDDNPAKLLALESVLASLGE